MLFAFLLSQIPIYLFLAFAGICFAISWGGLVSQNKTTRVFLVGAIGTLVACRLPILFYDTPLNPDEALFAANALKVHWGWLNWDIADNTTSGPLNSIVLAWPRLLGADITFFSTRLTGLALLCGAIVLLCVAVRSFVSPAAIIIAVTPLTTFLASTKFPDFIHYSSELLSVFLISAAIALVVPANSSWQRMALGCTLLGMVPFAKLQGTPIAAGIGLVYLYRLVTEPTFGRFRYSIPLFALLPAAVFLIPLAARGEALDFTNSYFIQQQLRAKAARWQNFSLQLFASPETFRPALVSYASAAAAGLLSILSQRLFSPRTPLPIVCRRSLVLALLLLVTGYAAVIAPGRNFGHYAYFIFPAFVLLTAAIWAAANRPTPLSRTLLLVAGTLVLVNSVVQVKDSDRSWLGRADGAFLVGGILFPPRNLEWLKPQDGESLVCWGWRAECYVDSAMAPATRDATNETQIYALALRPYFRARFLRDFAASAPDFVIDAVSPGSFGFKSPDKQGINSFAPFADLVHRNFERVSKPDDCPRLYVRKERLRELRSRIIQFAPSTTDPTSQRLNAVDDGSVYETCPDFWLTKSSHATITLKLSGRETVSSIHVLAARGDGNAGVAQAQFTFSSSGQVKERISTAVNSFPYWTTVTLRNPILADSIKINLSAPNEKVVGLNEIKLYRF